MVFSKNQHTHTVHFVEARAPSSTEAQVAQREAFQTAISGWRALADETKAQYNQAAVVAGLPNGMNVYLSEQLGGGSSGGVIESTTLTVIVPFDGSQDSGRLPEGGDFGRYNFRYDFDVLAEGVVTITTSGDKDPVLWLDDSDGNNVTSDDDSGGNLESYIETNLTVGTYRLEVGNYGDSGDATVDIEGLVGNLVQIEPAP